MIDFSEMNVGDKFKLVEGKWGDAQRDIFQQATDYAKANKGVQFQTEGNEGSDFERGQYWIVRTK